MIIKSLLFIIICIFCYETYKNINQMTEEYFIPNDTLHKSYKNNSFENLTDLTNKKLSNKKNQTVRDCKDYPNNINKIMVYKPDPNSVLDTPYYSQYKPLEYDKNRKYYWKNDKLIEEGIRRSKDDEIEIAKVQALFDKETNNDKKKILQDELDLFKWRKNIFKMKDQKTGINRDKIDIISDYYPAEIGLQRPWIERHSHLPNYSY